MLIPGCRGDWSASCNQNGLTIGGGGGGGGGGDGWGGRGGCVMVGGVVARFCTPANLVELIELRAPV